MLGFPHIVISKVKSNRQNSSKNLLEKAIFGLVHAKQIRSISGPFGNPMISFSVIALVFGKPTLIVIKERAVNASL